MGKVYLLGAGPGDPGLLTLKAKEVLTRADTVVYDYLANEEFLSFCRSDAELIYVGKQAGKHTLSQEEINRLLVERCKEKKIVARLKGGDPYVFGRGAEEVEELIKAGIEFALVPGVTSAVAAPAYAGIPLTHRSYASSVCLVTGHEDPNKPESALNWQALARSGSTLVFFMGVKNLSQISKKLIQAGLPAETPAGLVRWGTTCEQQSLVSDLRHLPEESKEAGMSPPALLVVGDVVRLKHSLDWFEKLPLLGRGIVVTRAREQASSFLTGLRELGACCYQFPTIKIEELADYTEVQKAIAGLKDYDWLVFTSVNGVKFFWQELGKLGLDSRSLGNCQVGAIGPATAESLKEKGILPDFVPKRYVAEEVVEGLKRKGALGKNILIPRAEKAREVLPEELKASGARVKVLPVYRTSLAQNEPKWILDLLQEKKIDCITFTSSSTVNNFFELIVPEKLKSLSKGRVKMAAIGPVTGATLKEFGFEADILPDNYTISGLQQAIVQKFAKKDKL